MQWLKAGKFHWVCSDCDPYEIHVKLLKSKKDRDVIDCKIFKRGTDFQQRITNQRHLVDAMEYSSELVRGWSGDV